MALSSGIGQALSNQNDSNWVTVVNYSGRGMLTGIILEPDMYFGGTAGSTVYNAKGNVQIVIDGNTCTLSMIKIIYGPNFNLTFEPSVIGGSAMKLPFYSNLQVRVQSTLINSDYVRLLCTVFYVKEV